MRRLYYAVVFKDSQRVANFMLGKLAELGEFNDSYRLVPNNELQNLNVPLDKFYFIFEI